jgi:hypothetical protein
MQKLIFIFFLTIGMLQLSAQENVFSYTMTKNSVTNNADNTKAVDVNRVLLNQIISENSNDFFFKIPLIDEGFLNVNMKQFSVLNPKHNLIIESANGKVKEDYIPNFQSYYIIHEGKSIGTFLYFENSIVISYKHNNRQFELNKIDNEFLLFDVNDCLLENTFSCKVEEKMEQINIEENLPESSSTSPKCLELAVEVDQHTRNTFSSNTTTTNWAHAIIAGVSQVYASEVNLNISIVTTIIWETTDPYASYINDASNMLAALRNHWTSNNGSISRDLVHLLTKRSNTGTGGIAYRDVLCNNSWGYGFSAGLNNTTNFNFPNPSYTWNLMVCSHEIGHNIESHHTHWCGWPGGPIDNCTDVEGSCTNNPTPQVGTIMSYCHTTSSGSLIDFHSIVVSNALTPGINGASCLTTCAFYGCTDPNATNYDPNATVDDGSCLYSPPLLTAIITTITCNGLSNGSIDLSVSGGLSPYTYIWSNGLFSQDLNNIPAGTYSLTVTDALGQVQTASYTVTEPAVISITYNAIGTSAPGLSDGAIYTTTTGGVLPYSYYWVSPYDTNQNLLNIVAGTYTFYAIDANNCFSTAIITVLDGVITPISSSAIISAVSCAGNTDGAIDVTVSGGVPPFVYSWTNGMITEDISGISAGNYDLTITDAQSQTLTTTYIVNEDLPLNLSYSITNATSNTSTDGAIDLIVSGGLAPYVYFWNTSPTQTTEDISGLLAGNYIVFVGYNSWLCFVTDTVTVNVIVYGCTGPSYCNYDSLATVDDGSCWGMSGCMDPLFVEYSPFATCDDGSCLTLINNSCTYPSPTGAYISELIHDRVRVNWDNMNDANCMVTQYRIRYRELGTSTWLSKTMANTGLCLFGLNTNSKKVVGLIPSTTYEYYMKAWYCGGTTSAWSATQNFTTLDECENVINFAVSTPTNTKASFTWDSTGAYSFARIKLREDITGGVWTSAGGFGVMYPALTKAKNGLAPGTSYRAQARTWCDPTGGAYRSATWSPLVFWTQPTSVRLEGGTSINNLSIYPNPSRDVFNVSFTSEDAQDLRVRILNVIGEELINENLEQFIGEYTKQINLSNNAKGIYFLEIETNDGVVNKKLILQ